MLRLNGPCRRRGRHRCQWRRVPATPTRSASEGSHPRPRFGLGAARSPARAPTVGSPGRVRQRSEVEVGHAGLDVAAMARAAARGSGRPDSASTIAKGCLPASSASRRKRVAGLVPHVGDVAYA